MAFQGDSIFWVEVEKIVPNPFQPRREFDEAKLKELSESVRMYGILQPLTVTRREVPNDDGSFRTEYELIAGERRLRASKLAGVSQVPVIIRDGEQSEQEKLELAIIENLQREDLNAVDRALAFRQLADVFNLSHAQVAKKVGRSREYVSNSIRILALPDYMLDAVRTGDISEGHARTLLMLNDRPEEQDTVFRETMLKKLSVREVERIARGIATDKVRKKESIDNDLLDLEKQFTETLGTRVSIVKTEFGGRLTIDYFSPDELQVMLTRMRDEQVAELQADAAQTVATLADSTPLMAVPESTDTPVASDSVVASVADLATDAAPNQAAVSEVDLRRQGAEDISDAVSSDPTPAAPFSKPETELPTESESEPEPEPEPTHSVPASADRADEQVFVAAPTPSVESVAPTPSPAANQSFVPRADRDTAIEPAAEKGMADSIQPAVSLRDQLALLLQKSAPSTPTASAATSNPAPANQASSQPAPAQPSVTAPTNSPAQPVGQTYTPPAPPAPASSPDTPKADDDSDLYSIKHFTV